MPEVRLEVARELSFRDAEGGARIAPRGVEALAQWTPEPVESVLGIVVSRPGSAVKRERDVLGNTRLDVVSREARALGIRAGFTVAAARAKCAGLQVRVVHEGAVHSALARVAEAALAFGPASGFDIASDVVWVDVGGCAHLHAPRAANDASTVTEPEGEMALARAIEGRVQSLGHVCRVAVASGPRIASAVARLGGSRKPGPVVVPAGEEAAAMRAMPIAALGLDDATSRWLRDLGLGKCGDLQKLPRRSLGTRLGDRARDVMLLLEGDDRAPFEAWRPPEVPEERVELEWGAASIEALAFVLKTLCDRLSARLAGRGMGAARLELVLSLDRALCGPSAPREVLEVVLPVPLVAAGDLLGVLRSRLEHHTLAAPVLMVTLRATEMSRLEGRTIDLLEAEPAADRALPRLVAELSAELGATRIGVLELVDTWVPDERTRLAPFVANAKRAMPQAPRHPQVTAALEPTRLTRASTVDEPHEEHLAHLGRVAGAEWWRRPARRRDLFAAWMGEERGAGALGWIEVDGVGTATLRGWID